MKTSKTNNSIIQSTDLETSDTVSGFRSVFKATSVFGGVQIFNILISLIKGKVLAVLIGSTGMGLNGLIISSLRLIEKASGLGLSQSAVRDISAAYQSNDKQEIKRIYTIFKHWIWITAIIGVVLTISLSPFLSKLSFGDRNHIVAFLLLSLTFIFSALTGGIYTLLRGIRKIKYLARANISGSTAGLLVSIPIFYFYGIEGVIPAIIASSITTFLISIYFKKKINLETIKLTMSETFKGGKQMVNLGLTLTASALFTSGIRFLLNAYISHYGSLGDLGIYDAGHSIMTGYVGMVFTAMGTDYYPRLSGAIRNPRKWNSVVDQQAEIVVLILGPILTFILLSAPILIRVLLTNEFLRSIDFIIFASIGILFKALSWVSGFVLIAKQDNKIFLYTEIASQIWFLSFNILFYNLYGITGLGISMIIGHAFSALLMFFVLRRKYKFTLSRATYKLAAIFFSLIGATIACIKLIDYPQVYPIAGATFLISIITCIIGLNQRIELFKAIRQFIKEKKNKSN